MEQLLTKLLSLGTAHTAHNKQQCKQLLHALLNVSQKHFEGYISASDTYVSRSKQLLKVLQPHLQLPHPYGSITATCMAYQILERLLQHLCAKQQEIRAQAQHTIKQEQLQPCEAPDEQQSRDTNTAAPPAHCPADPGLLCQLHACAGLCWQAIVSKPSDLGLARHVLQYHAAAQSCLVLIHQYCKPAGIGPQLQELLLGLLLHGTLLQLSTADSAAAVTLKAAGQPGYVVVKTEPTTASQHNQQQDQTAAAGPPPSVPLLASLKLLMRSSKAHSAAAKASTHSRTLQPTDPAPNHCKNGTTTAAAAAGAGGGGRSPGGALQSAVAATVAARAEELSVSGIKAWGLIAAELGPKLLDKAVGQPMLDVSATQSSNLLTMLLHRSIECINRSLFAHASALGHIAG